MADEPSHKSGMSSVYSPSPSASPNLFCDCP